MLLKTS